jgi:hypothetical protein
MNAKKLKEGEVMAFQRGGVIVLCWKDKKYVALLIEHKHNATMVDVEDGQKMKIKPQVDIDYNNTMGGVDLVHHHLLLPL